MGATAAMGAMEAMAVMVVYNNITAIGILVTLDTEILVMAIPPTQTLMVCQEQQVISMAQGIVCHTHLEATTRKIIQNRI